MPAPRKARSPSIWTISTTRAASDFGEMSPKPTVEKTVTVPAAARDRGRSGAPVVQASLAAAAGEPRMGVHARSALWVLP